MRRLFRRGRGKDADNNGQGAQQPVPAGTSGPSTAPSSRIIPQATVPGTHVCGPLCAGIASLPLEYHESIIAQLTQQLGTLPDGLEVQSISMSNPRIVPGETRDIRSELEERQDIEGNTELARIPLALPTTYQYPPLPKGHARFLRPGGLSSHPLAYLESHPLDNPPPYIAVSYCWDPTSARRGMFLDGQSFSISETVLEVINQVQASQHATGSRELLWIDQICINQDDQNEKLDQIYRMGEIYSKADKVFIWLGPTANRSDFALENMAGMLQQVMALNDATASRTEVSDGAVATINQHHGQLFGHLFMRPWFRRLWTVQEALLARKLVVMCGYREVDFDLLVELANQISIYGSLDLFQYPGSSDTEMNNAIIGVINLYTIRLRDASVNEMLQGLDMPRFRALVADCRSRQVTMAPDRVHALMGVAPHQVRASMASVLSSNPNLTMWQLYTHFTISMLQHDPEWYFLSLAPSHSRPSASPSSLLPSWVPNFDSPPPFSSRLAGASCSFTAGISPTTSHLISRTINPTTLTARGFRLDTVTQIIPQTAFREDNQNVTHQALYAGPTAYAARDWDQECIRLCQRVYNLGQDRFPRFHVDILLTHSLAATDAATRARFVEGYHLFWMASRLRDEALSQIRSGAMPIPERFRGFGAEAAEKFADEAVRSWRNGLSVEEFQVLVTFAGRMKASCSGRGYIATRTGLVGLGCPGVKEGDVVVVVYGCTVPFVLRERGDGTMEFVGDAYVYGVMDGEALGWREGERGKDEVFRIC